MNWGTFRCWAMSMTLSGVSQPVFVGRQREMAELLVALVEALSSRARLVMLAGEPGIGKTRIAQELADHAETQGAQTLWGWCYEAEGAPPYWPWIQTLRSYVQDEDPEQLLAESGAPATAGKRPSHWRECTS